jgi:hypothetical protein
MSASDSPHDELAMVIGQLLGDKPVEQRKKVHTIFSETCQIFTVAELSNLVNSMHWDGVPISVGIKLRFDKQFKYRATTFYPAMTGRTDWIPLLDRVYSSAAEETSAPKKRKLFVFYKFRRSSTSG